MTGEAGPAGDGHRWLCLTYTSEAADVRGAGGGWQVKQSSPGLSERDRERILAWVSTDAVPLAPLPTFPSRQQIAALPRALALEVGEDGTALLVHAVPAGPDSTGRPGNVFNHALLDRRFADAAHDDEPVRPVQMWRSPFWLTPYGAPRVRRAVFDPAAAPVPGTFVDRSSCLAFLAAEPARLPVLMALLDAVTEALWDGPSVVLVTGDVDEAALWVGVVCFLATPHAARSLTFSIFERTSALAVRGPRARLSAVLRGDGDVEALRHDPRLAVVDAAPAGGAAGSPARHEWAQLVAGLHAAGGDLLLDRLLAADEIGELNAAYAQTYPWWPLAVAVAEDRRAERVWQPANRVLARDVVRGERPDEESRRFVDAATAALGCSGRQAAREPVPAVPQPRLALLEPLPPRPPEPPSPSPLPSSALPLWRQLLSGDVDAVGAVTARAALESPPPLVPRDALEGRVLTLFSLWTPAWRYSGASAWPTALEVVLAGADVWADERVSEDERDRLAPYLLEAAVRTAAWWALNRDGVRPAAAGARSLPGADRLHEVARRALARRPMTWADSARGLMQDVFTVAAAEIAGAAHPGRSRLDPAFLVRVLDPQTARRAGADSVAGALLRRYLRATQMFAAQAWAERLLAPLPIARARTRTVLAEWARRLATGDAAIVRTPRR